ncbi:putative bifunctional diguanylate cyclase/phosphodiesterase [Terriglobus tenax]|uniref:putative bifunctional diguanylate cyclase/phosphodiesterase n=1 Tax=Terriglobus tenax TaxID=1111115 RepID=UPI0021E0DD3A|nr:bifunctional diguanylate cyclase/phosphodiesterase [Terriglobus tenax]
MGICDIPSQSLLSDREVFRAHVQEAIDASRSGGTQVAVFLIDIHRLYEICSSLPEREAENFLQELARRVCQACPPDQVTGRIRLDEMVVLLRRTSREEVNRVGEALLRAFSVPVPVGLSGEIRLTASIGVSLLPSSNPTVTHLMRRADAALSMARRSTGERLFLYDSAAEEAEQRQVELERELRQVLVTGGLFLEFQPIVHLATGTMTGAETLLRWRTESGGLIMPGLFVPLAEHAGMMVAIGGWVIREAFRQWTTLKGHSQLRLAVNVTASQLADPQLLDVVEAGVAETAVNLDEVEFEITENTLLREDPRSIQQMYALREMGIKIVVDDFGTGYSSIGYLRRFPVDRLKIDRSFVMNIPESQKDCALTRAVLAMSEHLGIPVVAEGVEREEQRRFLELHGCSEAQGYLFSPPVKMNVLEKLPLLKLD